MKKKINRLMILFFCFMTTIVFADVTMSDETYAAIIARLKKDQKIIETEQIRWNKLKTAEPDIKYSIEDKKVVIQQIQIPIHNSKPLVYEIHFEVNQPEEELKTFPFKLLLCGILETKGMDAKAGIQLFSIEKFTSYPIGFNTLIGGRSFGGSISYSLKKPFDNTMLHIYVGKTYSLDSTIGVGISLNF